METDLMAQGLQLMLVGMGSVYFFLSILVVATMLMSRAVARFGPRPIPPVTRATDADAEEVAAITAAIARFRRRR